MERHFEVQLEKLKTRLIKMCSLVDEQVEFALRSIEEENAELARLVIERDQKVDKYDLKIDKICQKLFALSQPVATDLRLILSSLTINNNLERIGDIAVNLAEAQLLISKKPQFYDRSKLKDMMLIVREMISDAIDSFIEQDPKLAEKVIRTDAQLDSLNKENHSYFIDVMKSNQDAIENAVAYLVMSRQIERLGDHATNIAENVYFIVQAEVIKHNYEKYFFGGEGKEAEDDED